MNLEVGNKIRIIGFDCGRCCKSRYSCMGIIKNVVMEIKTIQPLHGPIVVKVGNSEYSIGRGMFNKLKYEVIKNGSSN